MAKLLDHVEAEWQFDADNLKRVESWIRDLPSSVRIAITAADPDEHLDTYFDTADWRIFRAGYALRLRRSPQRCEATLKSLNAQEGGLTRRREITQPLTETDAEDVDHLDGPLGKRISTIRGQHQTRPLFTVITLRQRFQLWCEGQEVGELALDHATFFGETFEEQTLVQRVEVETTVDLVDHLRPFVDSMVSACDLRPAAGSKFATGIRLLGLQPTASIDAGSTEFDRTSTISELAYAVLRRHFIEFLRREPGTRLGDDPEELHDMRVAARRLRAALSLFSQYLPPAFEDVRSELRWVASALGDVRDLDVQLEEIKALAADLDDCDAAALEPLLAELHQRRNAARERMLQALDSERYDRLVANSTEQLRSDFAPTDDNLAVVVAPDLVRRRLRKFRRLADRLDDESKDADYHRLRIDGKRLRYTLEFVAPLYGKPVGQFIRDLVAVQDVLGRHQDSIVAVDHLRDLTRLAEPPLPASTIFVMGRIAERYAIASAESRDRFPTAYKQVSGKSVERLERELERLAKKRRSPRSSNPNHNGLVDEATLATGVD